MVGFFSAVFIAGIIAARTGKKGIGFILAFIGVFGGGMVARSPYFLRSVTSVFRHADRMEVFQDKLETIYVEKVPKARWKLFISYDSAWKEIKELMVRGTSRLNDSDQLRRAELVLTLSEYGGDKLCSAFFAGGPEVDLLYETLKQLPEKDFNNWTALSTRAVEAELEGTPFLSISDFAFSEVLEQIFQAAPESGGPFLKEQIISVASHKPVRPADTCRANKLLHGAVLKLGTPNGSRFMRYLSEMNSGTRQPASAAAAPAQAPRRHGEPPVGRPITNADREALARELSE